MNNLTLSLSSAVLMGLGATLTLDLWASFLKHAFKIAPSNFCLVGRWVRYMPEGTFSHSNIGSTPQKRAECAVGWIAHYLIGVTFAIAFVLLAGNNWFQRPRLIPAVVFGAATVLAPFLIMQPALGLGIAAAKTANPPQARLRSMMNHMVFGMGLYLFGWLVSGL